MISVVRTSFEDFRFEPGKREQNKRNFNVLVERVKFLEEKYFGFKGLIRAIFSDDREDVLALSRIKSEMEIAKRFISN
jgi:hypothetical protein